MKSILAVEYTLEGVKIRVTNQFEIKNTIMDENAMRFKLFYSFLLFKRKTLD